MQILKALKKSTYFKSISEEHLNGWIKQGYSYQPLIGRVFDTQDIVRHLQGALVYHRKTLAGLIGLSVFDELKIPEFEGFICAACHKTSLFTKRKL